MLLGAEREVVQAEAEDRGADEDELPPVVEARPGALLADDVLHRADELAAARGVGGRGGLVEERVVGGVGVVHAVRAGRGVARDEELEEVERVGPVRHPADEEHLLLALVERPQELREGRVVGRERDADAVEESGEQRRPLARLLVGLAEREPQREAAARGGVDAARVARLGEERPGALP